MLPSHHAPSLSLRLEATDARPSEALLALGPDASPGFAEVAWLSRTNDLAEAAANLFAMLRLLARRQTRGRRSPLPGPRGEPRGGHARRSGWTAARSAIAAGDRMMASFARGLRRSQRGRAD
jgi:hypothetical protein